MLSSLKLETKTFLGKEELKKVKTIWQSLRDNNDSSEFRKPVDWKGMGLYDYLNFVEKPMDLESIQIKLREEKYSIVEEVLDDIQLIWDNCKSYNQQGSWIYDIAEKLQKSFKKMIKTYLPMVQLPNQSGKIGGVELGVEKQEQEISYHDKVKFSERLKKLPADKLGELVEVIVRICPLAFRNLDDQKAQIYVDNMDILSFREINDALTQIQDNYDHVLKKNKT